MDAAWILLGYFPIHVPKVFQLPLKATFFLDHGIGGEETESGGIRH